MGDDHLSTFSTDKNVPIPKESEETSRSDSNNDLPSCDDSSSIEVTCDDSVTFSNLLFKFDVNFHNPLFDKELKGIECKDSYDSNLDESTFLVTPLSDSNKDEIYSKNDNPPFKENEFDLKCKTNDEDKCFNPGGDNDKDLMLLCYRSSYDTTHNLSPRMFFDHEPQQLRNELENEPLITFSPKSDPLHHEFTGEIITIPPGIVREHEVYINRMSLLCGNSSS
ncbi:hypothetical protein Tco_1072775 [Tanacetum coccineum]